jgi:hypothetical protein
MPMKVRLHIQVICRPNWINFISNLIPVAAILVFYILVSLILNISIIIFVWKKLCKKSSKLDPFIHGKKFLRLFWNQSIKFLVLDIEEYGTSQKNSPIDTQASVNPADHDYEEQYPIKTRENDIYSEIQKENKKPSGYIFHKSIFKLKLLIF